MNQLVRCLAVAAIAALASPVVAADLSGTYMRQCVSHVGSQLISLPTSEIKEIIVDHFETARTAMSEPGVLVSRSPAFTWAFETRIACGNAIGYLKTGHLDPVSVQKCDCFYQRFASLR